ncbi:hypothetical protein [Agrobacterium pusense]|uniref:hypothetical protein n=1 Tax=Agrobacterium pusense TaxID=648995 RepID=UPI0022B909E5|nr:hypothetical protein [Agrobacterium pusense]MCZ7929523.1 hypothetical protein [Agrobacterium pusense]
MIVPIEEATIGKEIFVTYSKRFHCVVEPAGWDVDSILEMVTTLIVQVFAYVLKYPCHGITNSSSRMSASTIDRALVRAEIFNISYRSHRDCRQHGVNFRNFPKRPNDQISIEIFPEGRGMGDTVPPIDKALGCEITSIDAVVFCPLSFKSLCVGSLHSVSYDDRRATSERCQTCEELLIVSNPSKKDNVTKGLPSDLPAGSFPRLSAGRPLPRKNVCEHEPSCPNKNSKSLPSTRHESPRAAARKMSFSVRPSNTEVAA